MGAVNSSPQPTYGTQYSVADIPMACTSSGQPTFNFNLSLAAISPLSVPAGQQFNLTSASATITVPGSLVSIFTSFYGGNYSVEFIGLGETYGGGDAGPGLVLDWSGATPSSYDASRDFVVVPPPGQNASASASTPRPLSAYSFGTHDDLPLNFPSAGTLDLGPFTAAGPQGAVAKVADVSWAGFVAGYGQNGMLAGYLQVVCNSSVPLNLFSVAIS